MKKILLISYFFPPCNLTASQRVLGWARYLNKFGYYPIVITRNWELPVNRAEDVSRPTGNETIFKKEVGYEVYYLPYKGNLKDKIYSIYGDSKFVVFRKFLSIIEILGQNFMNWLNPFSNIYNFSKQVIQKERPTAIVISGNPFVQFRFGYLLNKKYKIPWIADYRDDWSTDELDTNKGLAARFISWMNAYFEKKWVSSASHITSVSPHYVKKISTFTGVTGSVIFNGFFEEEYSQLSDYLLYDDFTLTYNGTLYPTQNIELFIEGFKLATQELKGTNRKIQLLFPGLAFKPDQANRVQRLLTGYEDCYTITNRILRADVLEIQKKSHVLLMFPHSGIKGIPSSKLYEYMGLNKFTLICPSDNDILESTINATGNGIICNTTTEVKTFLVEAARNFDRFNSRLDYNKNLSFTREAQTKTLASILNSI